MQLDHLQAVLTCLQKEHDRLEERVERSPEQDVFLTMRVRRMSTLWDVVWEAFADLASGQA